MASEIIIADLNQNTTGDAKKRDLERSSVCILLLGPPESFTKALIMVQSSHQKGAAEIFLASSRKITAIVVIIIKVVTLP